MIRIIFTSGPHKGTSVLTALTRQSAQEYIDEQASSIRGHLGILETREQKANGQKRETGK